MSPRRWLTTFAAYVAGFGVWSVCVYIAVFVVPFSGSLASEARKLYLETAAAGFLAGCTVAALVQRRPTAHAAALGGLLTIATAAFFRAYPDPLWNDVGASVRCLVSIAPCVAGGALVGWLQQRLKRHGATVGAR